MRNNLILCGNTFFSYNLPTSTMFLLCLICFPNIKCRGKSLDIIFFYRILNVKIVLSHRHPYRSIRRWCRYCLPSCCYLLLQSCEYCLCFQCREGNTLVALLMIRCPAAKFQFRCSVVPSLLVELQLPSVLVGGRYRDLAGDSF